MINIQEKIGSYDYILPSNLIAQKPHEPVDKCKLMMIDRTSGEVEHCVFDDLKQLLKPTDVLFFNNSKVLKARIHLSNATIERKGDIIKGIDGELFYLSSLGEGKYHFLVKPGSKLKIGTIITLGENRLTIVDNCDYGRIISFEGDIVMLLDEFGQMPLPPYIGFDSSKESLYQPVFASNPGSVASPTASLHFTENLLYSIRENGVGIEYVTLHIGLGTFKSIDTVNIKDYIIHSEKCEVDITLFESIMRYKQNNQSIIAVGTTACRTLESLPYCFLVMQDILKGYLKKEVFDYRSDLVFSLNEKIASGFISNYNINNTYTKISFECRLYITPGFNFHIIDQLITNFHLPKSSLMVLVASFMGYEEMIKCYELAIKKNYMFYSFGDAMWIK